MRGLLNSKYLSTGARASLLLCLSAYSFSSAMGESAPKKINLNQLKVEVIQDVVIPIPQEIFASLDKLGQQSWRSQVTGTKVKLDTNRARTALLFGMVVADGFIAVQAEDRDEVKRVGRQVLELAGALGVKSAVNEHALSIIEGANAGEWRAVKHELDSTRETVIQTMEEMRDQDFATLVSIGGWLGGTRALASLMDANYKEEGAELLHQPELLADIIRRYREMPAKSHPGPLFDQVEETLVNLKPLMKKGANGNISKNSVTKVKQLTGALSKAAYGN
ncbi:MAG: hypothetical protein GXP30_07635 [Verrucomicrobia bacterium]|nr:hypothetical protein [Verrucomicrobiota bacterium]